MYPMFQNPVAWPAIPSTPPVFTQPNLVHPSFTSSSNASGILSTSNTDMNGEILYLLDQINKWNLKEKSIGLQENQQMAAFYTPPTTPIQTFGLVSLFNNGALNVTPHVQTPLFNILPPLLNTSFLWNFHSFGKCYQIPQVTSLTPPATCSPGSHIGVLQEHGHLQEQKTVSPTELLNHSPILNNRQSQSGSLEAGQTGVPFNMQEAERSTNQQRYPYMAAMTVNSSVLKNDLKKAPKKFGGYGRKHKWPVMDQNEVETDKLHLDHYCYTWAGVQELAFVIKEVKDHFRLNHEYMSDISGIPRGELSKLINTPEPTLTAIEAAKWFHQFMRHPEKIPGFSFFSPDKKMIFEPGCQNKTGGKVFYNEKRVDDVLAAMDGTVNTKTYEKQARKTREKRSQTMQNRNY